MANSLIRIVQVEAWVKVNPIKGRVGRPWSNMASPGVVAMHKPRLQLNKFWGMKGVLAAAGAYLKLARKSFGLFSLLSLESGKFEAFHIWMHPPHLTLLAGAPLYQFRPIFWPIFGNFFIIFLKGFSSCISLLQQSVQCLWYSPAKDS